MIKSHRIDKYTYDADYNSHRETYECNYTDDGDLTNPCLSSEDPNTAYKLSGTGKNEIVVEESVNPCTYEATMVYRPDKSRNGAVSVRVEVEDSLEHGGHGYLGRIDRVNIELADYVDLESEVNEGLGTPAPQRFSRYIVLCSDILQQGGYDEAFEMIQFINEKCQYGDLPYGDPAYDTDIVFGGPDDPFYHRTREYED